MFTKRMILVFFSVFVILSMTAAQCGAPTTVVVTKEVEKIVKETVVVEKVVTKEVVVTATPEAMLFSAAPPAPDFKNPDTYLVAVFDEVESFEPAWSYDIAGMAVLMNIYEGMIFFERDKVDEFVPQLATDWEVSDDGLTYTFNIRQGVEFHEGGALEPHDIAYSLQRAMLQDRLDGPMWLFLEPIFGVSTIADLAIKNYAEAEGIAEDSDAYEELTLEEVDDAALKKTCEMVQEAVQADDDARTVTLKLGKITPWFLQILAQPWGAALDMEWMVEQGDWDGRCDHWIEWHDPALEQTILFEKTNGTGPYKLDRWTHGEEILLVANEDYWRTEPIWEDGPSGPPKIEQVNFKLVRDWDTRLAMLHAGDADYAAVPEAFYSQVEPMVKTIYLEGDEQGKSDPGPGNTLKEFRNLAEAYMTPALFNFSVNTEGCNPYVGSGKLDGSGIPPDFFSDIHVRKAFNYCFDWDAFLQDGLGGNAIQPRGPIIKGVLGYDENSPVYSYDPAKCEEEFRASGWKAEDGSSLWDTGFYFQLVYNTGNEPRRIAAEIIKKNVEAINPKFTLTIINLPWTPFMEGQSQGVFPIFLSGWGEDYHDPSNWVYGFMSSSSGSYARTQKFPEDVQREIDDLIAQGLATTDVAKRETIYQKLQQIAYEQAIDIFLYQSVLRGYFQRWIHGFYFNPIYPKYGYSYIYALSKSE
jgi:peptide/nickel transport system substrate-binding protein